MFTEEEKKVFAYVRSVCKKPRFIPDGSVNCNKRLNRVEVSTISKLIDDANSVRQIWNRYSMMTITSSLATKQTRISFEH